MARLATDARSKLARLCVASSDVNMNVHTATFQPVATRPNQDRLVTDAWDIAGQRWIFLAICDGHVTSATAEHTIAMLPQRLQQALHRFVTHNGATEREAMLSNADTLSRMLSEAVRRFDQEIGAALKEICPEPEHLTEAQSEALVKAHHAVVQRAYSGTTLVAAIVNVPNRCVWTLCVGDSTVGITFKNPSGRREWKCLCEYHRLTNPREYFRVVMAHPFNERQVLTENDRVLGHMAMTRSIGDHAMKLDKRFSEHIFEYTAESREKLWYPLPELIKTPPYMSSKPSVQFLDLDSLWHAHPIIVLFSDGVDCIVQHYYYDDPQIHKPSVEPGEVIASILGDGLDRCNAQQILGHPLETQWKGDGNKAIEVLADLFGGTDAQRISHIVDPEGSAKPTFRIDDTTLILCNLTGEN
ncbi:protein serine/threonine phosphatase 2C [Cubamyces lactineus]|nr:protein serine/threonine phosphatase 2C [Cubamyces lactineus]